MNLGLFLKPIVITEHYKQRKEMRATKSDLKRDLSINGFKYKVKIEHKNGNIVHYVFTKNRRQYRLIEKDDCFVLVTMIQHNPKQFIRAYEMTKRNKAKEENK